MRTWIFVLAAVSVAGFLVHCGKKGDPVLPHDKRPVVVSDLTVASDNGSIVLSWTIAGKKNDDAIFRILRSSLEIEGDECPGCPRTYYLIAECAFQDKTLVWKSDRVVSFRDDETRGGRLYSYKIVTCNASGICSDESNIAELKVP
jgi:hypothetical protein